MVFSMHSFAYLETFHAALGVSCFRWIAYAYIALLEVSLYYPLGGSVPLGLPPPTVLPDAAEEGGGEAGAAADGQQATGEEVGGSGKYPPAKRRKVEGEVHGVLG